jgi:capsular polysaccharide export protein
MSGARLPLLRAPPFPWVKPAVAAVSQPMQSAATAPDPARIARLLAAIRTARVGGPFWNPPAASLEPGTLLVQADRKDDARRLLDTIGRVQP